MFFFSFFFVQIGGRVGLLNNGGGNWELRVETRLGTSRGQVFQTLRNECWFKLNNPTTEEEGTARYVPLDQRRPGQGGPWVSKTPD